jgi:hypothetical protein
MDRDLSDLAAHETRVVRPSFPNAFRFWLKLGFISFGGQTGQIAIMQTELVENQHSFSCRHSNPWRRCLDREYQLH